MKNIVIIMMIGWLQYTVCTAQTRNITDVNNKATAINDLQGKKILLVVLPLQKDTGVINQLLRFQKKNAQRMTLIGLVAVQPVAPTKEAYKETYSKALQEGIIISEGLQPSETVASERESVIQWISGKSNNRQLDRFATGSKYFLSEDGRLYAQLGKGVSLDDRVVQNILNTRVPKAVISEKKGAKPSPAPSPKM